MSLGNIGNTIMGYVDSLGLFNLATQISTSIISHMPTIVIGLFSIIISVVIVRIVMKVF